MSSPEIPQNPQVDQQLTTRTLQPREAGITRLALVSVEANPVIFGAGARDYYVICATCGWARGPLVFAPDVLTCPVCDEMAGGQIALNNLARASVRGGYRVECVIERK